MSKDKPGEGKPNNIGEIANQTTSHQNVNEQKSSNGVNDTLHKYWVSAKNFFSGAFNTVNPLNYLALATPGTTYSAKGGNNYQKKTDATKDGK